MYRRYDVIAKMVENKIVDFSQAEIDRVFCDCASPIMCKRALSRMRSDGLTLDEIYNPPIQAICKNCVYWHNRDKYDCKFNGPYGGGVYVLGCIFRPKRHLTQHPADRLRRGPAGDLGQSE